MMTRRRRKTRKRTRKRKQWHVFVAVEALYVVFELETINTQFI
jgi:hypothetical protein